MAASSGVDGAADVASTPAIAEENEHNVPNSNESESRSRFGLNLSITELLQNWGLLNLSPFRRKSSKPSTPSPSSQSPQKQPSPPVNSNSENIELVQLSNIKVSDALWKNVHSKIGVSGDVFFSNMPLLVSTKALSQQLEAEQKQSFSESDTDSQHSYNEQLSSKLKEEDEMEQGIGHNFSVTESSYPTWCDRCGDLLWGLYESHYLRCSYCHYTCHQQCHGLVTLDCRGDMASSESKEETQVGLEEIQDPEPEQLLIEDEESSSWKINREELQQYILEYNASIPSGLDMTLVISRMRRYIFTNKDFDPDHSPRRKT